MLKLFRLAAKLLWREWRAGEWYIVFFALVLAIAATTTIHFYINRLQRGLEHQSAKSLGGDLVISSPTPLPTAWSQKAAALQLKTTEMWSYLSVVSAKNQLQLVSIQAVSKGYPLIGDHKTYPNVHTIWVEPRLLPLLSLRLNDSITIGTYHFRLAKILTPDIDTFNSGWAIAPRVLMRLDEVPATRTVLPGSRVDYRLLLAGEKKHRQQFIHWLRPQLKPSQRLLDSNSPTSAFKEILGFSAQIRQNLQIHN